MVIEFGKVKLQSSLIPSLSFWRREKPSFLHAKKETGDEASFGASPSREKILDDTLTKALRNALASDIICSLEI